jgi:phosphoethanolamine N-methyltransferase
MGDNKGAGYELSYIPIMDLVWGKGFIAPGGEGNVDRIVEGVELQGKRVLELGSGCCWLMPSSCQRRTSSSFSGFMLLPH